MVANIQAVQHLLDPSLYPQRVTSDEDRQLVTLREQLRGVLVRQQNVLDLISGFVDTQQMGELQAAAHEYDASIMGGDVQRPGANTDPHQPAGPTPPPSDLLGAGLPGSIDKSDPRFLNADALLASRNPLSAFADAVAAYQQDIGKREADVTQTVLQAVSLCGGHTP